MTAELRSRVLGLILGRLSRGGFPQREPVAWLYNGVRLPKLPAVHNLGNDKWIILNSKSTYVLRGNSVLSTIALIDGEYYVHQAYSDSDIYHLSSDGSAWVYYHTGTGDWEEKDIPLSKVVWTKHDITGDNTFLGSDPIPVYE
jgi:hypothetical protein